jgi:hypothetical protein
MGEICFFSLAISMYILNFGTWDIASSLIDYSFVVVDDCKATYFANPDIRTAPDLTCAILATIISIENWSRQEPYGSPNAITMYCRILLSCH